MKLIVICLLAGSGIQAANASDNTVYCDQLLKSVASKTINLLQSTEGIEIEEISCSKKTSINKLDSDLMFLTTGKRARQNLVCMSDSKADPCKVELGIIKSSKNPNKVLSEAFNIKPEIDLTKPIEESIERLFIKPSEQLLPTKTNENKSHTILIPGHGVWL